MRSSTFWADDRSNQYLFTFNNNNNCKSAANFSSQEFNGMLLLLSFSFLLMSFLFLELNLHKSICDRER